MSIQRLHTLTDEKFKRKTGLTRSTFEKVFTILSEAEYKKNELGARPNKIDLLNRILMWLEYLREYRTYFHIASSYGVSEATCYRNCVWIEDILIQSGAFNLKNRHHIWKENIDVVAIDASESQIERPKKSKEDTTLVRKRNTLSKLK